MKARNLAKTVSKPIFDESALFNRVAPDAELHRGVSVAHGVGERDRALAHVARGGLDVAGGFGELAREVAVGAHGHVDVGAGVDAGSERGRQTAHHGGVSGRGERLRIYCACGRSGQIAAGVRLWALLVLVFCTLAVSTFHSRFLHCTAQSFRALNLKISFYAFEVYSIKFQSSKLKPFTSYIFPNLVHILDFFNFANLYVLVLK